MAMLEPSPTTNKKSRGGSTRSRSSSAQVSTLPSPESLQKIEALEKRITEMESKGQADSAEIARLNSEIAKLNTPEPITPNEPAPTRKSFFGF